MEDQNVKNELMVSRSPILGKYLWILFWMIVPTTIVGLMRNESLKEIAPSVYLIGNILGAICYLVYCFILFKLSSEEEKYRTAGICLLFSAIGSIVVVFILSVVEVSIGAVVLLFPLVILDLMEAYYEYHAHASVLRGIDDELSRKWSSLWTAYLVCNLGMAGSTLCMLLIPFLGVLGVLGFGIGTIVVGIMKLVRLYRTAKIFH